MAEDSKEVIIVCCPQDIFFLERPTKTEVGGTLSAYCRICKVAGHPTEKCMLWKTKMCWNTAETCAWGDRCSFAHTEDERRAICPTVERKNISSEK